jgi:DNA-binding NtrC family response regulator
LFRINTVEIYMPALRNRREDIAPLALAALQAASKRHGRQPAPEFEPEALRALQSYSWPGNVRELRNVIERAVLLAAGGSVGVTDLRLEPAQAVPTLEEMSLEDAERALIRSALKRFNGSAAAAAEALGLSRSAIYRRLEKLGISTDA